MMRQYLETKQAQPDCLLFMRMGDFYEVFLDDAVEASRILGLTLTCRNRGDERGEIPMAGVPHHQLEHYLPRLLAAGRRVAIMDQLEDPAQAKGLVKRGLTRVISAGTLIEDRELDPAVSAPLVALTSLATADGPIGIAALDCASGRLMVEEATSLDALAAALARLLPAELVLPEPLARDPATAGRVAELLEREAPPPIAALADPLWHPGDGRRHLCASLGVGTLDGFGLGDDDGHLCAAAAAALRYATMSLGGALAHVRRIIRQRGEAFVVLDAHCQRNLELVRNNRDGGRADTLLATVDRTRTAAGARLLSEWLRKPLREAAAIALRHDAVGVLVHDDALRDQLRESLASVYDLERLAGRIATGRANARDLVWLARSVIASQTAAQQLQGDLPPLLRSLAARLGAEDTVARRIATTLVDDPPLALGEGGMVRDGVLPELDELRGLRNDAGVWLADYQEREAARIGVRSLKVGYNRVFGYYIELGKQHAERLPPEYVRKQTLVNAERYITPELKEYEDKALGAEDRIRVLERRVVEELREAAAAGLAILQERAAAAAELDVLAGLAECARRGNWCRPELIEEAVLDLQQARHPVVERVLGPGRFVANDCRISAIDEADEPRLLVITGPNMAGKSTYIRQVALAVILAQAGSFVPAEAARVGLVDRVFTRIGAGDELARNLSTFMVEMAETAAILNNATARSLVVLDEVGRGTSTFDGLSLAWAITEHLHDRIGCRCLFATHYHELTDLAAERPRIANRSVAVAERDDDVVFLHRIVPGAATRSYGIHVARLAGVPTGVITRAREVQATLDELDISLRRREAAPQTPGQPVQLTIFDAATHPLVQRLRDLDPDRLSPREAHDLLYALRDEARRR